MNIVNDRNGARVGSGARELRTSTEKAKGLIGASLPTPLVIKTRWGIHTFGVRFPIDAVVLDGGGYVRKIAELKPNRMLFWNPEWPTVIELPNGSVSLTNVSVGDHLSFVVQ